MSRLVIDNETPEVLARLKKRRNIYTIAWACLLVIGGCIGVIPTVGNILAWIFFVLWGIAAGFGMACINVIRHIKSGGRKGGGGLWWWALLIFGMIIVPFITVVITSRVRPLAEKVMGVKFE